MTDADGDLSGRASARSDVGGERTVNVGADERESRGRGDGKETGGCASGGKASVGDVVWRGTAGWVGTVRRGGER